MAAGYNGVDHDPVADRKSANVIADRLDLACEFVTDHPRIDGERIGPVEDVNVGTTDAGAVDTDEHFVACGFSDRIWLDGQDFRLTDDNARHGIT